MADAAPFTAFLAVETHRQEIVSTRKKSRFKFTYGARFVAERHGFGSQLVHFLVGWQLSAVKFRISPESWNRWENLAHVSGWPAASSWRPASEGQIKNLPTVAGLITWCCSTRSTTKEDR